MIAERFRAGGELTYASIKLEMSESPPTPAAGPPTALDIIPDMLTTQEDSGSESVTQ